MILKTNAWSMGHGAHIAKGITIVLKLPSAKSTKSRTPHGSFRWFGSFEYLSYL
jgi:hypothetical protein